MGLLGKAIAISAYAGNDDSDEGIVSGGSTFGGVQSFFINFHRKNPQFHAIVLQGKKNISGMIACHGGAVAALSGGNILVLLPGVLDRELFAHRLGRSAGLSILSQMSADSPSFALETLNPYLQ